MTNALPESNVEFRKATGADLPEIISLLAEIRTSPDAKEDPAGYFPQISPDRYLQAFSEIEADRNNELVVGVLAGKVVAVYQMTCIPGLTLGGAKRAVVEGVRVSGTMRGRGLGKRMMEHAMSRAREEGCTLIQLTTNSWREDAIAFYESLGFQQTHVGLRRGL